MNELLRRLHTGEIKPVEKEILVKLLKNSTKIAIMEGQLPNVQELKILNYVKSK